MDVILSIVLCSLVTLPTAADDKPRDILVIGAGASGLAAARNLTNHGGFNVVVLEARPDRYGGRVWTNFADFPNASGSEVDMGASFIHYPDKYNSVLKLHRELKLPVADTHWHDGIVVREKDGKRYTLTRHSAASDRVHKAFYESNKLSQELDVDISVKEALRLANQSSLIDDPLSQLLVSIEESDYGSTIDNISAQLLFEGYGNLKPADKIPLRGYSAMLQGLVDGKSGEKPLDIRLDKEVIKIEWRPYNGAKITCRDGSLYEADAAVVTIPLGVLKANVVDFVPNLPEGKLAAIKRLGFGVINKLVLEFDQIFWPDDIHAFAIAVKSTADRGKLNTFLNYYSVVGRPVLIAFASSYFGKKSEDLSDDQLKDLALRRLRTVFGSDVDTASLVRMARTRWLADPFSRGVYSFPAVGTTDMDWDIVGGAEVPLFFGGEHTRVWMYGTVQTALDTGNRAAKQVVDYIHPKTNATGRIYLSALVFVANLLAIYYSISW